MIPFIFFVDIPTAKVTKVTVLCKHNGNRVDKTSSMPKSVLCLKVDEGQGLLSGILFFTSLVLLPIESGGES